METRGSRIKKLRTEMGLSQRVVAELMGYDSKGTVSQWESNLNKPKDMERLANILRTNTVWLETGKGDKDSRNVMVAATGELVLPYPNLVSKKIPVISWVQAGMWSDVGCDDPSINCTTWMETSANVSSHAFALDVRGDSMHNPLDKRSIPDGARVVVDPVFDPSQLNRRIVVAMLEGSNEATIKEFVKDGPNMYLNPLNPKYPTIPINEGCRIIAVALEATIKL